ncbi:MAG: tRNA (adenosine(37)-N6)-threonylcarbamoyltransferase complex ATPase subunit type 1 TsaE [Tepidisphaera sp.]|nr:tRNA (adenosine(37)-N6)-threonylcarbamoyltransferase complex ATPase subunit type 1 TsaE [Tepidisphaera sp.]
MPAPQTFDCPDLDATLRVAARVAASLTPGCVIALHGPMGAGKTTFVRGLAAALGVAPALVSSPTFVVINTYPIAPAARKANIDLLIHVDAYRLSGSDDLDSLGWERLFDEQGRARGNAAAIIEWPQKIAAAIGRDVTHVKITPVGESSRRIEWNTAANPPANG